jgi:solute carrier family 25 phosphate transporter 23/24/25/41
MLIEYRMVTLLLWSSKSSLQTVTNPLERIKMLSQTGEGTKKASGRPSILGLYRDILQKEGILGLWAGNGANL